MDIHDADYVAQICNFIFDDNISASDVTPEIAEVGSKAFHAALKASNALDLVPRPTINPTFGWLISSAVRGFWRTRGKAHIYTIAKNQAERA